MTTRYYLTASPAELKRVFKLEAAPKAGPRYNIAPTQMAPIVIAGGEGRSLELARWGFVPAWSRDPAIGARLTAARAESVAEEPAYQDAFRTQRCLVPANGFYVWQQRGTQKQPHRIALRNNALLAFAGVWENWQPPEGEPIKTFAIITTPANRLVGSLEDRMPAIIAPADHERWLTTPAERAGRLLVPYTGAMLAAPVSTRVNNLRNDDADLLMPVNAGD